VLAGLLVVLLVLLPGEVGPAVRLSVQCACFVTALVVIAQSLSLAGRARAIAGGDRGRATTMGAVVLRGSVAVLSDDERQTAVRYASAMPAVLAFQAGYLGLLWAGIVVQQLGFLDGGLSAGVALPILSAAVIVVAAYAPITATRIRRARAYARANAHLLAPTA